MLRGSAHRRLATSGLAVSESRGKKSFQELKRKQMKTKGESRDVEDSVDSICRRRGLSWEVKARCMQRLP